MRDYTFYKDGQEYQTDNLAAFCREHKLRRSHMAEVAAGMRTSYKGWSLPTSEVKMRRGPINVGDDEETIDADIVFNMIEDAAKAQEDPEYEAMILDRVAKMRRGEPLEVRIID